MSTMFRSVLLAVALLGGSTQIVAQDKEMTENPYFKYWSKSKVGATVTMKETTKVAASGPCEEKSEEVKQITHKLLELTAERAVVETVVTEGEVFGLVESAPTKHIYPAKMSKEVLQDLIKETGAKGEPATIKVGDVEVKATHLTGTMKGKDDEVSFSIWLSDDVPGGIVKRVRTTKVKGEVVAETTIEVEKFAQK
jgi:hypothetical protein